MNNQSHSKQDSLHTNLDLKIKNNEKYIEIKSPIDDSVLGAVPAFTKEEVD